MFWEKYLLCQLRKKDLLKTLKIFQITKTKNKLQKNKLYSDLQFGSQKLNVFTSHVDVDYKHWTFD